MNTVLIGAILLGTVSGGFCGLCIANLVFDERDKHTFGKISIILLAITIFSVLCYGGLSLTCKSFNNGICPKCGTHYQAIEHKKGSTYYECPECFFGTWY